MSSLQSFLESTECGTTNPIVDLARQFTSTSATGTIDSVSGNNDAILSLDELNSLTSPNGQNQTIENTPGTIGSAVESLLNNTNNNGSNMNDNFQSVFNMESLLEEMNRLEPLINNDNSNNVFERDRVFKTDLDPLIGNHPVSIEKDFWTEAIGSNNNDNGSTLSKDIFDFSSENNNVPELNVDWADEYLKGLEFNNNNAGIEKSENIWNNLDKNDQQKSFRNPNIDFFQSSYSPFSTQFDKHEQNIVSEISDANLNDLVSDQESRLMNMLLGNNTSNDTSSTSQLQTDLKKDETLKTVEPANIIKDEQQSSVQQQSESMTKNTNESGESFFYENPFDDVEFWMKLAEEWHSIDDNDIKESFTTDTHVGEDGKMIQIRESIKDLLDEKHPYFYRFVENNPFFASEQSTEQGHEKSNTEIVDYIEEGRRRMDVGDLSAAVLLFEAATQKNPEDPNAWRLLGIANAKNENDHKSISALKRCLAQDAVTNEQQLEALMYLATSFTNESMNTEACYALQEWLRQHPKYKDLVRDHLAKGDMEKNETYLGPTPLSQRWSNKKNIFADGFFESIKQSFIDAVLKSPADEPDPDVQCALGVLYNISGEFAKAIDCFRTALNVRPDDYQLWNRYGASLANGGKAEESMFAYREALQRYPGYIRARYNLAISCIMLGVGEQAAEHLLAILNLQTAGADSIKDLVSLNRDNITSSSVWNLMRSALQLQDRQDLLKAVDERNLELLNQELRFNQTEPEPPKSEEKSKTDNI